MVRSRRGFFALIVCLVAMSFAAFSESASAQATSGVFKLRYAWGYSSVAQVRGGIDRWPQATFTLNPGGVISTGTQSNVGSWSLIGNQIMMSFAFNSGTSVYTGTRQTDGSFIGTMVNGTGWYGAWKGSFQP